VLVDEDRPVREVARSALKALSPPTILLAAATGGPAPVRFAAALLAAERSIGSGLAAALRPIVELGVPDLEKLGELRPRRLADRLAERLPAQYRTSELSEYIRRFVTPDLLDRLADKLSADVETRW